MTFLANFAKFLYFFTAFFAVIGAFIQLNIKFNAGDCRDLYNGDSNANCLSRSLVWHSSRGLRKDYNKGTWRQVFTLQPNVFVDVWTPLFLGGITIMQHFKGGQSMLISGSWIRALGWIGFWTLFGVIGYAGDWGVFWGFFGFCAVGLLYVIQIFFGNSSETPVLQIEPGLLLGKYFPGFAKKRGTADFETPDQPIQVNDNQPTAGQDAELGPPSGDNGNSQRRGSDMLQFDSS